MKLTLTITDVCWSVWKIKYYLILFGDEPCLHLHKSVKHTIVVITQIHCCGAGGSMPACHVAGPSSIPGREKFPGWGFFGVFPHLLDKYQEVLGPQGPQISFGPQISSFHIRLATMIGCVDGVYRLSCLCFLGVGPGIELIPHPGRTSMSLCGQKSRYVIQSLIPSPDRSWLCKARVAWVA